MKKGLMVVLLIIMWTALLWGQETFLPYFRVGKFISADSLAVRALQMTTGNMQLAHNSWLGISNDCRIRFYSTGGNNRVYCYGTIYVQNGLEIPSGQIITLNGNTAFDRDGNHHRFGWIDTNEYISFIYNDGMFIKTNNVNRFAITHGGNIGIGDSSPEVALDVDVAALFTQGIKFVGGVDTFTVTITADKFTVKNDANPAVTVFAIDSAGTMEIDSLVMNRIIWQDGSVLTLASGVITATKNYHLMDTEGGVALDTLTRIEGGHVGMQLILETTDNGRDIFIDSNAAGGNIFVSGGDFTILERGDMLGLIFTVQNVWRQIFYSNN